MNPTRVLIGLSVLLIASLASAGPVVAKVQRTFPIYATDHDPGVRPTLPPACLVPPCEYEFTGTVEYRGPDLTGIGEYALYFREGLDGKFHYHGYTRVRDAWVNHCGQGEMTILYKDGTTDPATLTSRDEWWIESGSGTEQLTGLSGSGYDVIRDNGPAGTDGEVFGSVTCQPSEPQDRRATADG